MSHSRYFQLSFVLSLLLVTVIGSPIAESATVSASSCSLQDVQAAINSSSDGDVVEVPNGSCSWSGGISTKKQIRIEAQNYVPTKGGTMVRNVTITHNAGGSALISMTTGNTYPVGVIGIRFNAGSGTGNYIRFTGTGTKPPLIGDCAIESPNRFGSNPDGSLIAMLSLGGVIYNTYMNGLEPNGNQGGVGIFLDSPRAWETASTMGQLDTDGNVNVYVEDSTVVNSTIFLDIDQGSRAVVRNCLIDGTFFETHGFTSGAYSGGRHVEIYDNKIKCTGKLRNLAARYFWLRAGTVLLTNNDIADADDLSYGHITALVIGDTTSPVGNDGPMQPGWGHNGTTDVRDPIYMWNNTGARGSTYGFQDAAWNAATNVAKSAGDPNGELFVNLGAKPGWSRYSYPHPLRAAVNVNVVKPMPPSDIAVGQ